MNSRMPIFILGNPRSGTTLLRLMVGSHPAISIPPECGFAVWWRPKYRGWSATDATGRGAEEFVTDLSVSKKIETWGLDFNEILLEIRDRRPEDYASLVSLIYENYARKHSPGSRRWGDKNNFYVRHVAEIREIFGDAQFLHIVRDGRDVACSYRELASRESDSRYYPDLPFDLAEIAAEWTSNIASVEESFRSLPEDSRKTIRYEDLVRSPEIVLRDVCEFLQEAFDPGMLDYHVANRSGAREPFEFLEWKSRTLESPDVSRIGRYLASLRTDEVDLFDTLASATLQQFGYPVRA